MHRRSPPRRALTELRKLASDSRRRLPRFRRPFLRIDCHPAKVGVEGDVPRSPDATCFKLARQLRVSVRRAEPMASAGRRAGARLRGSRSRVTRRGARRSWVEVAATGQVASAGVTILSTVKPVPNVSFHR